MGVLLPVFGRPDAWRRLLTLVAMVVAAVVVAGSPAPATAAPRLEVLREVLRAPSAPPSAGGTTEALTAPDAVTAGTIARLEGRPVEIMSERSETTQVFALPDGTRAAGVAAGPVRALVAGDGSQASDWAEIDPTLTVREDGTIAAAVHVGALTLSPGSAGDAAAAVPSSVARLTLADGSSASLEWEGPLPAPRVEGARAVYEDVRPGVDLVVDSLATGVEQYFVVHEPPSSGDALSLPLSVSVEGAASFGEADGELRLVGADGNALARFPQPALWDAEADADRVHPVGRPWQPVDLGVSRVPPMPDWGQAGDARRRRPVDARAGRESVQPTGPAPQGESLQPEGQAPEGARGPAMAEQVPVDRAVREVGARRVTFDLAPPVDVLTDPATRFPVIVDPAMDLNVSFDTSVQSNVSSDLSASGELLVGSWNGGSTVTRSFVNIVASQFLGNHVHQAFLYLYEHHSYSCNPRSWEVWNANPASTATRWNWQPITYEREGISSETRGYSSACPDGDVKADITSLARKWASWPSGTTFGMMIRASNEADSYSWKRFYSSETGYGPYVWINYNAAPSVPTGLQISPSPQPGVNGTWTSSLRPTMRAIFDDADGGQIDGNFYLRDAAGTILQQRGSGFVPVGSYASMQVDEGKLVDGQTYTFTVRGSDWIVEGPPASLTFGVDVTAPLAPTVTSSTHDLTWGRVEPGAEGTFSVSMPSSDATVVGYRYGLDKAPDPQQVVTVAAGAPGEIKLPIATAGHHVLNVQAVDHAGNTSGIATYAFYVGQGGLIGLVDGAQVVRRVRLDVDAMPTVTSVSFQWRRGPDDTDVLDVPAADLATSAGRVWTTTWRARDQLEAYTSWDVGRTLGFEGGPAQVRARLATGPGGTGTVHETQWVTLTVDPDADGAATTAIGPGSVNLLTGDHYLSATDVEEFGLALTRTSSSRDTDAGYELQVDRLDGATQQGTGLAGVTQGTAIAAVDSARHHTGTTSIKLVPNSAHYNNDTFVALGGDLGAVRLGLQPGRTYRFSGWVYVPAPTSAVPTGGSPRAMRINLFTKVGGVYNEPSAVGGTSSPAPTRANAWQRVSFDATIPVGATEAFVRLYDGFAPGSGQAVYWDDISIRELWSPFGPEWSTGTVDAAAGTAYTRISHPYEGVASVHLTGGGEIWFTSGDQRKWWPEPGAEDLTLTKTSDTTWRLTELDGTVTDFALNTGTKDFPVQSSSAPGAPGASRHVYDVSTVPGVSRLSRVIAPVETGVDAGNPQPCTTAIPARGCEVLELEYATTTTASGSTLGSYAGRVSMAFVWSWDAVTARMEKTAVARYRYDATGRLREVDDPRVEAASGTRLVTAYAYDAATGRVTSVTPSGEPAWRFTYGSAGGTRTGSGDLIDPSTGRLLKVTRASLLQGSTTSLGSDNTTTLVYSVPLTRGTAGGPYDLSPDAVAQWAQQDGPTDATAVFGPQNVPTVTTATSSNPGQDGYRTATVHYLNSSGREVNTASPLPASGPVQGFIDTAEYDRFGHVVRTLDASNRLLALRAVPDSQTQLDSWGLGAAPAPALAQQLDARTQYSADGLTVVRQTGPVQLLATASDGLTRLLRPVTETTYDEGAPDTVAYRLPTTVRTYAEAPGGTDRYDEIVTTYGYTPVDSAPVLGPTSGWVHKQATRVTVDATGPRPLTSTVIYDAKGRVVESRRPGSTGTDAGTTRAVYWTAGANPADAACGNRPEWAGQPCLTRAGGPVTGHDPARMAGQLPEKRVTAYNRFGSPTVVTETAIGPVAGVSTTQSRTTTTTYDDADRVDTVKITGTGTGVGAAVATTQSVYDPTSGDVTRVQSLDAAGEVTAEVVRQYDILGRLVRYTDATGGRTDTTYDQYGRPVLERQWQLTATGTQAIGTREFAYAESEPRGFVTSITDYPGTSASTNPAKSTITAAWGPDGQLEKETLAGGVTLTIGYDPARVPVSRTYTRSNTTTVLWKDSVTENHRGQWVKHNTTTGGATYTYDRLGRLVRASTGLQSTRTCVWRAYEYDDHSNREQMHTGVGAGPYQPCPTEPTSSVSSTYDSADRLSTGFGGAVWTYDPLGRTTAMPDGDGTGIVANEFYVNDLIAAQQIPGQVRVAWGLDPVQRRSTYEEFAWVNDAWASSVTKVSHYATDSDEPAWIVEDSTLPSDVTRLVSGVEGDLAITTTLTGGRLIQLVDLHGDVVGTLPLANSTTTPTWAGLKYFRADEFGNPINLGAGTPSPGRYGWLGGFQRSGEALGGVVLMGVRLYQPATGRFMSPDPVPGGSASAYDYCSADPVNCTDLGGTFSFGSILNVVAAVGEVASMIPGPIGAAAAGVSAVAYAAQGNTAKAIEMGVTAAAALVGAGAVVRVAARAVNVARAAGQAARAAPRVARAGASAASRARAAVARVTSTARRSPVSCRVGNSFEAGTLVVLADGTLAPIETLATGDLVLATDPVTGETTTQPVIAPIVGSGDKHLVDVVTDAGTWTATANHPIWVDGKGWTDAIDVTAGDQLVGSTGGLLVVQAMHDRGLLSGQTVYNLSVAGTHTYYIASADGTVDALVHNCPGAGPSSRPRPTPDQQALLDLGQSSMRRGVTPEEARILERWRVEYGVSGHGLGVRHLRVSRWQNVPHIKIGGFHIRVRGR